jgi:hypothetical protein
VTKQKFQVGDSVETPDTHVSNITLEKDVNDETWIGHVNAYWGDGVYTVVYKVTDEKGRVGLTSRLVGELDMKLVEGE